MKKRKKEEREKKKRRKGEEERKEEARTTAMLKILQVKEKIISKEIVNRALVVALMYEVKWLRNSRIFLYHWRYTVGIVIGAMTILSFILLSLFVFL